MDLTNKYLYYLTIKTLVLIMCLFYFLGVDF